MPSKLDKQGKTLGTVLRLAGLHGTRKRLSGSVMTARADAYATQWEECQREEWTSLLPLPPEGEPCTFPREERPTFSEWIDIRLAARHVLTERIVLIRRRHLNRSKVS